MLGFIFGANCVALDAKGSSEIPSQQNDGRRFLSNHPKPSRDGLLHRANGLIFGVLYCFFVIAHDRRRILQCNVTKQPCSAWVVQQVARAFPYDSAPGYLIFDRGAQFNEEVIDTVKSFSIQPKRTSFRSPWQNDVAERWVGNCRRDLLDHVIVLMNAT